MKFKAEYYKTPEGTAAVSALIAGVATHLFGMMNVLHNIDDIGQQPYGYGTGITSGRWFLTLLGDFIQSIGGNYNLPYVNGLLFMLLLAAAAGFMVSIFHIRSRRSAAMIGMLFVVFPAVTSAMLYRYTSAYYGVAILFSVLAAWILKRSKFGLLLSALLTACSLGVYQAYVPLTIGIFVLMLIQQALEGNTEFWKLVRQGFYYCLALILGLLCYYLILKIMLGIYGVSLSNYNGVNEMGKIALADIPRLVYEAFYYFCMMPIKDYCGLANVDLLRKAYLLLGGIAAIIIGYILVMEIKKPSIAIATGVLCLLFPIAVNFVVVMCPNTWIYTLMLYAFVLVACVPIILFECLPETEGVFQKGKQVLEKGIVILTAVIILGYAYYANVNYTAMHFSNRQIENYFNSLVAQIRMTEGFDTEKEWVFIGEVDDPLLRPSWDEEMTYGGTFTTEGGMSSYTRGAWLWQYIGYLPARANAEKAAEMSMLEEVKAMPCWPDQGSIKVIGDSVVIKFQELSES